MKLGPTLRKDLSGPYFSAVDLASIAQSLDAKEQAALVESGGTDADVAAYMKDGSHNYDDSGFFSVQVMEEAMQVWSLRIVPVDSRELKEDPMYDPLTERAFICNLQEHWFTLRHFGSSPSRWYNMNSLFSTPSWISPTYLSLFLAQLKQEGYSIWVVRGQLPHCDADAVADTLPSPDPAVEAALTAATSSAAGKAPAPPRARTLASEDVEFERAIAASLGENTFRALGIDAMDTDDDPELAAALRMSLSQGGGTEGGSYSGPSHGRLNDADDELRAALRASLEDGGAETKSIKKALEASRKEAGIPDELAVTGSAIGRTSGRKDEDAALEAAIRASLSEAGKGKGPASEIAGSNLSASPPNGGQSTVSSALPPSEVPVAAAPANATEVQASASSVPPSEMSADEIRRK
ncbi:Josephin-domain-containing protein [Gonapodya prolifera JEL478]|uniref:ubiquitinyl hydrolase 1 n=1 Tax=Gonapodya prolifera (strain JEL478) TaxID=1344416 RepID=A0A139AD57_GONPJ|nr:Josephin-domain-containing protein [Gonapodya prolifera JEL478]|eukprot:KXS14700.1 Josephin-domain-containing protein [Gonapodya prolifera JEL478]